MGDEAERQVERYRVRQPLVERARQAALAGSATWKEFVNQLTPDELDALGPLTVGTLGEIAKKADHAPPD